MAYTNIDLPTDYFNTVLWTGNNADNRSITGVGHQPDMVWQKTRNQVYSHSIFDNIRGVTKRLVPNDTASETTVTDFKSFDSDGFTIDQDALQLNATGDTNVGWCWKANGAGVSNTAGSITSTVSANTTSGFSIVSYTTPTASGNFTVGHGIGTTPVIIITKTRGVSDNWYVYSSKLNADQELRLNTTGATTTNNVYGGTRPTSSVFTLNKDSFGGGLTAVSYCFADVKGFSKFGSYTGNGSTDGTFVYTGFKPAFVIWKCTDDIGENWCILDSKRDTYNLSYRRLNAESSAVESTSTGSANPIFDMLSNGFKHRGSGTVSNGSGNNYIYMAFAENPFVSSKGIPTTAR